MKSIQPNKKLTAYAAIALTVVISTFSTPQPAEAQVLELATGAINALFNRPPKPLPNHNFSLGTSNLNGNTFNLCLFPCTPGGMPSPVRLPVEQVPSVSSSTAISSPGSFSQSRVSTQTGTLPPGVRPGMPFPGAVVPQPTPPRPALVLPPIRLPINLPL
ncbi:hypothetical protein IQ238_19810 [Pleurocapsales cyanobacterium LEGE 06147]|nr:hypothetical protein [Pleurocapsales cyanobacterium LEGE 06147]